MPFFKTPTDRNYVHPFQDSKVIGTEPVQLEHDNWLDVQIAAGLIVEIKEDTPSKGKKPDQQVQE